MSQLPRCGLLLLSTRPTRAWCQSILARGSIYVQTKTSIQISMAEHVCACFADCGLWTFRRALTHADTDAHLHADGGNAAHAGSERGGDSPGGGRRRHRAGATTRAASGTSAQRAYHHDQCTNYNRRNDNNCYNDNECTSSNDASRSGPPKWWLTT